MSKQKYKSFRFTDESYTLIYTMDDIVSEYMQAGFMLTVRQLYYQLVARNHVENTERSYKRVTSLANDARLAGLIDWDAIEDRTRAFVRRSRWKSGKDILKGAADSFHMDLWEGQQVRPFVIIEKEALVGVLTNICHAYDVPVLAARGYPSGTVLREFAIQDIIPHADQAQDIVVIHLGDHDPSGIDMTRDLEERIALFAETSWTGRTVRLERIALNMDQIEERKPPPNPAKTTDSRYDDYRRMYGTKSWELDALPPTYLVELVEKTIVAQIAEKTFKKRVAHIKRVRAKLTKIAREFKD